MKKIEEIVDCIHEFPTLPTIYTALLEVMSDSRSTINDVANIISTDQASSLKILKTVNSSIFGLQKRVENISEAIFHLGFNEVKNLVLSLSVIKLFSNTESLPDFKLIDLWKHSLAVGVITRTLGKFLGIKNIENYFLAGIMHDLGKLFFLREYVDEYSDVVRYVNESRKFIEQSENEVIGVSHTVVGDLLAEKWNLPGSIRNSIKYHETGFSNGKYDAEIACVHLANIISRILQLGNPGDDFIPEPNHKIWDYMDLNPSVFTENKDIFIDDYNQSVSILLVN